MSQLESRLDFGSAPTLNGALAAVQRNIADDRLQFLFYGFFVHLKSRHRNDFVDAYTGPPYLIEAFYQAGGTATDMVAPSIETLEDAYCMDLDAVLEHMRATQDLRRNFIENLVEYGCRYVWIAPILGEDTAGYGVLNHFCDGASEAPPIDQEMLEPLASAFHQSVRRKRLLARHIGLTSLQVDTLHELSQGKTIAHLAQDAGVSPRAIELRVEKARKKLAASNAAEAVYKAMAYGILPRRT